MTRSTVAHPSVKSSELSRNSADVFSAAERGRIRVTRRDGETLVLDTEQRVHDVELMLEVAAQLIAATLEDSVIDGMIAHFPWIAVLNADEQAASVTEIVRAARAAFALYEPHQLFTVIEAWRNTAEAIAAGTASTPLSWLDQDVPVHDPRE